MSPTPDKPIHQERRLTCRSISPGLGIGKAWVVGDVLKWGGSHAAIIERDIEGELLRLSRSFEEALAELDLRARRIEAEFDSALAGIFRAHGEMLREIFTSGEFEREMRESLLSAEAVVRRVLKRWYKRFEAVENQTVRQRADDVLDLGRNLIRRLRGDSDDGAAAIPPDSILVVERLLPSDVVALPKGKVAAVVVATLGQGSHAALLAREKGIPTVTGVPDLLSLVGAGTELLVDGFAGSLIIAPDPPTRDEFQERLATWRAALVRCRSSCHEPAITRDGQRVRIEANIGLEDDVAAAVDSGADGVGLLRIEQLYFARQTPPSEDELFTDLERMIAPFGERPVTIRLLDAGGDKPLSYLALPRGPNPVLGQRGVRLLLEYPQVVRTQMGAILRLSREHFVRALIPMVTLEDDIRQMREAFDALRREHDIANPPPFGAMIETPAAALSIPRLAEHVDFFCVGTNDLAQYTLAAARDDAAVNDYYLDGHESVLRLLAIVAAEASGRPVTICGELAGREAQIPQLLKLGFRDLSVAPNLIPTTKDLVRTLNAV